ncbi:ubiquitin carboxyl-terminal hydrolase 36 [Episyrphus balteatus]|uniref:ubiquitin carboxyl-terminal hydrolase 36 n=1 Tax=Episyrphus balteatus TaxID=286459 RepID=UPI0024862A95|nr:ubiquitin carboxyl-terminal hydrolase 36 [Episyrphus balteatus]
MMGCTSSQPLPPGGINAAADPEKLVDNSNPQASEVSSADKYPPAEAFEVSLDDVDNDNDNDRSDSLIKKHPPKRLQKLVEQAATAVPATTIEHLEEKLAKAEVRRQQYIQQRIENIITLTSKGGPTGGGSGDVDEDGDVEKNKDDDKDDQKDGQKDGEAAVIVSSSTTTTTTSSNSSHQDADVVVQPTASLNETSLSVDKEHVDGDHHQNHAKDNDAAHH